MKLSEISLPKIVASATPLKNTNLGYNKNEIETIVFEKEKREVKEKCNIGFIFGGISMIPYRVDRGIELYEVGLVDKLLVSGGVGFMNTDRLTPEAFKMRDYLLEHGINKKDIIVEAWSRNTIENIKNSFILLTDLGYNYEQATYALITSDFHVRRCLGLFANFLGRKDTLSGSGIQDGVKDINNWNNNIAGKKQILMEAYALALYAKQQKLEDIEIPELTRERQR